MNKEMICKNCKYHYIEELTFDYPQSCCNKRSETTEQWCKCNDFEYSDRYIEQLQQKVNQLETNRDEVIGILKEAGCYDEETKTFCDDVWDELPYILEILERGQNE